MSATDPNLVALVDPGSMVCAYTDRLATGLAAEGLETALYCAPSPYHLLPQPHGYRRELAFARWLSSPRLAPLGRSATTRRAGRALGYLLDWARLERRLARSRVGIVHLQWSLDARCDAFWLRRLRRRGVCVAVTVHNAHRRADAPGRVGGEARLLAAADVRIVLAESVAAELRARFPALRSPIAVIPPGVPARREPGRSQVEARARWGLPAGAPVALFFGLVRPYKGVERLLGAFARAAAIVPEARLVVAGRARDEPASFREALRCRGLSERVLRIDRYLSDEEAEELLTACDLVALPYREGSASAVALEAWRHERLPLASAIGALADQVIDGETGQSLAPDDEPAWVAALVERLGDRQGTLAAGRRAAAAARRRFPLRQEAMAHAGLYREILRSMRAA